MTLDNIRYEGQDGMHVTIIDDRGGCGQFRIDIWDEDCDGWVGQYYTDSVEEAEALAKDTLGEFE